MRLKTNIQEKVNKFTFVNLLVAGFYVWFYDFIFLNYIVELFHSPYNPMSSNMQLWLYFSGAFPIIFYKGLKNVASIFSIFVYIFAYIPFNETLSVGGYGSVYNDYRAVFFISMCFFFATDGMQLCVKPFLSLPKISYKKFETISLIILFAIILLNIRNLHLTNFISNSDDMYDLRENLNVVGGTVVIYILFWLKNAILPIILIYSLKNKNNLKCILVFIGCILIYMIDQQKITFIAPFVIVTFYLLYKVNSSIVKNYYHMLLMGALIVFPYLCYSLRNVSDTAYVIAAILIMRTQCIEGMELNTYFDWFGHSGIHPYTYYTHINFINAITGAYPYDTSIGRVVTGHGANANGVFWLMDGIAAGGLWGCIFISIIYIIVKALFNGIKYKCDVRLFAIISTFAMASAMNVSLFTSLLSCGLIVLYILFVFVDFSTLKQ